MMNKRTICTISILALLLFPGLCRSELVTSQEAALIAANWVDAALSVRGAWGDSPTAGVSTVEKFVIREKSLGFVAHVDPHGFVLVSPLKGLTPVKAWSCHSDMPSGCDVGACEMLGDKIEQALAYVEANLGPLDAVTPEGVGQLVHRDLTDLWDEVLLDRPAFHAQVKDGLVGRGYFQGEEMIQAHWDQTPPFNNDCPFGGCSWPTYCNYNMSVCTGCVATAGAQIMHHWHWPPQDDLLGSHFDWPNMLDEYSTDGDCPWSQASVDAVAHLMRTIGDQVDMDYGCESSGASTSDMESVYESNRYSDYCTVSNRIDYTTTTWLDEIAIQLNNNQVCQYAIHKTDGHAHSMVLDGYNSVGLEIHFHYGHGYQTPEEHWYGVDDIPRSILEEEFMVTNIKPVTTLPGSCYGLYSYDPLFPYRYVTADTYGHGVTIASRQRIQFFPEAALYCNEDYVKIIGSSASPTMLFTRGDLTAGAKIMHMNGTLALYPGGAITLF
jgi:hypothetical protein